MKKLTTFAALLVVCVLASPARAAAQGHSDERCSNADLRGVYSFVASGTFGTAPFATAGQTTYDGHGNMHGVIEVMMNGAQVTANGASRLDWSGTYTVDPGTCTATKTANVPNVGAVEFFVTFADGFKELRFIATNPGAAISGTARKQ
jgi:hypothetical protein